MIIYDPYLTGSLTINGALVDSLGNLDNISSSVHSLTQDSASFSTRVSSTEGNITALNAASSSYALKTEISGSFTSVSQSFASERLKNTTDILNGDLTVTGTITAQEFHTEFVSASILYQSGSTQFGNSTDDEHNFTGTLTNTGNVGIGTTDPSTKLEVNEQTANTSAYITVDSLSWNAGISLKNGNGTWEILNDYTGLGTTDTLGFFNNGYHMVIDNTGKVGIGTSSPAKKLDVNGTVRGLTLVADDTTVQTGFNGNSLIQISRGAAPSYLQFISPTNQQQGILFGDTDDTVMGSVRYDHTGDYMWFEANNAERMRIDSSGKVGIGATNPTEKLTVNGNINFPFDTTGAYYFGIQPSPSNPFSTSARELIIRGANAYQGANPSQAQAGGDVYIKGGYSIANTGIGAYAGDVNIEGGETHTGGTDGAGIITLKTAGTERMRINSGGNVGIGITNPTEALTVQDSIGVQLGFKRFYSGFGTVPAGVGSAYNLPVTLNQAQGTTLTSTYQYKIFLTTTGTGTYNSSVYIIYINSDASAWVGRELSRSGTSSNHPELDIINGSAVIFNDHPNAYGVYYRVETTHTGQAKTSPNIFGSDFMWQRTDTRLTYEDGNVGIGTSNPSAKLDVNGITRVSGDFAGTGQNPLIQLYNTDTSLGADQILGDIDFYQSDASGGGAGVVGRIRSINDSNFKGEASLTFHTGEANVSFQERMRITSGGAVIIGTGGAFSAGSGNIQINRSPDGGYIQTSAVLTSAVDQRYFYNPNGLVGRIETSGSSTSYITTSDYRLKENVIPLTNALDRLDALKPSRFNFIADGNKTVDGFLAHEVQDIVPEAISGEKDATEEYEVTPAILDEEGNVSEEAVMGTRDVYQGIDQSKIVPLLTAALQEANALIKELQTRVHNLENN